MAFGAYIQSVGVDSGTGTSAALAFGSNNTANNLLFLLSRFNADPGVVTITDTRVNTWGTVRDQSGAGDWGVLRRVLSCGAGANTVTLATTNSCRRTWAILEYTGPGVQDDTDGATGADTTPATPALVTTVATELIVAGVVAGSDVTITAGASHTQRLSVLDLLAVEDRLVVSTGSYTPTFTYSFSEVWTMMAGSFYETAAPGHPAIRRFGGIRHGPRSRMRGVH